MVLYQLLRFCKAFYTRGDKRARHLSTRPIRCKNAGIYRLEEREPQCLRQNNQQHGDSEQCRNHRQVRTGDRVLVIHHRSHRHGCHSSQYVALFLQRTPSKNGSTENTDCCVVHDVCSRVSGVLASVGDRRPLCSSMVSIMSKPTDARVQLPLFRIVLTLVLALLLVGSAEIGPLIAPRNLLLYSAQHFVDRRLPHPVAHGHGSITGRVTERGD